MFRIVAEDGDARAGSLRTAHGILDTPLFIPVATKGTVKTLTWDQVEEIGLRSVMCNSLILHMRPGSDVICSAGGIRGFSGWPGVFFADSGGFQSVNPDLLVKTTDEGAIFKSPYSGEIISIRPADVMVIHSRVGADVVFPLDQCPPIDAPDQVISSSARRTLHWARISEEMKYVLQDWQKIFGIVQGGLDRSLREKSASLLASLDFDGFAIGGLLLGESPELTIDVCRWTVSHLPKDRPIHLMGLGNPNDIVRCVSLGIDIFDSAYPTRNARHGTLFTRMGRLNMGRSSLDMDESPVDPECMCYTCRNFTRSYLNHLYREREFTAYTLGTIHNLRFMVDLMADIRTSIMEGRFKETFHRWTSWDRDRNRLK